MLNSLWFVIRKPCAEGKVSKPVKPVDDLVACCFVNETGGESPLFQKNKHGDYGELGS
jgi:hypothetical protein